MWAARWNKKDVPTRERQKWARCVHNHNAPAWGTNVVTKRGPPLWCKPNHFSRVTMAPSAKKEKKKKFFLTSNWFISHYGHFKRTGHGWLRWSLTKPRTCTEAEFWGASLSHQQQLGVRFFAAAQRQARNGDIKSNTEKTGCHIFNFALITNAVAVYSGTFASLLLSTRGWHASPL